MKMDLKQLEVFVHVVKRNSFSKAANTVFLSQPTISAHISALEKELGTQLLVRSTKEVQPTKAGMDFYLYAHNILALRDQAIQSVKKTNTNIQGEIVLLSSSVPAQYLLPESISQFSKRYPRIMIHVHQSNSDQVEKNFRGFLYDFGITGTRATSNKYTQEPFYEDTLVFACPADLDIDPPAVRQDIASFIRSQPFVMREAGSGTRHEMVKYLEKLDLTIQDLRPVCSFSNTQGVINAVASGMGISFVSKAAVSLYVQEGLIKTLEIQNSFFNRKFYLLTKKGMTLSPIQSLFKYFLLEYFLQKSAE